MHALIDLDILCYEIGSAKQEDRETPLQWPLVRARVDSRIGQILEATEAETWRGYLTGSGNFRDEVATIRPYKGTRKRHERPFWYQGIWNYLINERQAEVVTGYEADDALSIEAAPGCIICSRDKDLLQVEGWHYVWPSWKQEERHPFYVNEIDGLRFLYKQLLTGDTADNIPGLHGVGDKAASVLRLNDCSTELEMFRTVKDEYEKRFGSYWDMFMCENGRLLWMLRHKEDDWYERQKQLTHDDLCD